ncbi:MAG: aminotransferase class I/II-fold pyridoxal phosphate-dependent enzyme [Bacteroidota bacterium]
MIIPEANRLSTVKEYYFSKKLQEIREMQAQGMDVINLGIGNPDNPPARETIEALSAEARNPRNHGYQSYRGIPELRQAISKWLQDTYGTSLNADSEILPLIGSKEGIFHIAMAFLNEGDEVLVPNPGYPAYASASQMAGASIRYYHLDEQNDWRIDLEALEQADLSKVKIMWVNFPNMPTGTDADLAEFQKLITLAKANQFLIVNDNPYSLILNDAPKSILSVSGAEEVALELNSMSKSHHMAGWRVGWVAGRADYLNTILKVKSNVDSGMFKAVQLAAAKALTTPRQWHDQQNEIYANRKQLAHKILDLLGCTYSQNQKGMFVWARIPDHCKDAIELSDKCLYDAHVFITPGVIFGSQGERHVRISLCSPENILETSFKRLEPLFKTVTL